MELPQKLKELLIQLGDNAYCESIRIAKTPGCLGWEAKVKSGSFSGEEMAAHKASNEAMGRHRGIYQVLKVISEFGSDPCDGCYSAPVDCVGAADCERLKA
jgi:hypothetical protein